MQSKVLWGIMLSFEESGDSHVLHIIIYMREQILFKTIIQKNSKLNSIR